MKKRTRRPMADALHTDVPIGAKVGTRRRPKSGEERRHAMGLNTRRIVRQHQLQKSYSGCASCTFYTGAGSCFAYKQIPQAYLSDGVSHTVQQPGTGGFTYRRVDPADVVTKALDAGIGPHLSAWFGQLTAGPVRKARLVPSERIIVGHFYPNAHPDGRLVVDTQGDIITMDELRKTMNDFMAGDRVLGIDHTLHPNGKPVQIGVALESVLLTKRLRKALDLPADLMLGWVGAARVDDEAAWQSVLRDERLAFSVGGRAQKVAIAESV